MYDWSGVTHNSSLNALVVSFWMKAIKSWHSSWLHNSQHGCGFSRELRVIKQKEAAVMASPSYSEDLNCPLCLSLFNSPVVLPCGHSFCSPCITEALGSQQQCPLCRSAVAAEEAKCLPANLILKSLVEKAQREEQAAKVRRNTDIQHVLLVLSKVTQSDYLQPVCYQTLSTSRLF